MNHMGKRYSLDRWAENLTRVFLSKKNQRTKAWNCFNFGAIDFRGRWPVPAGSKDVTSFKIYAYILSQNASGIFMSLQKTRLYTIYRHLPKVLKKCSEKCWRRLTHLSISEF